VVQEEKKKKVLGIGLDNDDGHVRITRSRNFHLMGGSKETHELMQEKSIRFDEKLDARGKELEDLEHQEFADLAADCDMNVLVRRPGSK